ncbi:MAG: methylenetetrahydrofolate reductase (NADPH) [Gammaproteobacteria bacterium]|jgi:methylenetetrahydrofolate reductase (NADPH)
METKNKHKAGFSFEFFPPRSPESKAKLRETQDRLAKLRPAFFSVTYGAGGSTRDKTFETVVNIKEKTGIDAAPHLSCVGSAIEELEEVLAQYKDSGFKHIVALRGDLPSGSVATGSMRYANELVEFIRKKTGDYFRIDVACYPEFHPQAKTATDDLNNFKRKVEAGADSAITQYFYNADAYFRFMDSCKALDIDIPIVPGIMPITNCTQLVRFSEACGAEIPRWILQRLRDFGDDRKAILEFGIEVTTSLCEKLLANDAPGLHFYTMNQSVASEAIWKNLGLDKK